MHAMNALPRLKRTLLFAGVFALLAMVFVPMPMDHGRGGGYRLIFDTSNTGIAFFQLLINVVFAALAGAIVASLPKRVLIAIGVCIAIAAAVIGETARVKHCWMLAQDYEGYAESWLSAANYKRPDEAARRARQWFLDAASNWRLAWQFDKAEQAKRKANDAAARMETIRQEAEAEVTRRAKQEELASREKEFSRQWEINAQRVMDAYPELRYENSLYSQAMRKVLSGNAVYSQRVDGFEQAYKIIVKQLPPPTGEAMPTSEFYGLLERLKVDVTPLPISTAPNAGIDLWQWKEEEKLIHDPIDYQRGKWTTGSGEAFVAAKFFERNLGDRKAELDALADQLGAQKRYTLIEKQKRDSIWWVRVFLYKR
jgi:hypothetical protein